MVYIRRWFWGGSSELSAGLLASGSGFGLGLLERDL